MPTANRIGEGLFTGAVIWIVQVNSGLNPSPLVQGLVVVATVILAGWGAPVTRFANWMNEVGHPMRSRAVLIVVLCGTMIWGIWPRIEAMANSDRGLIEEGEQKFWCGRAAEGLRGRLSISWEGCNFRDSEIVIVVEDVIADRRIGDRYLDTGETIPIMVDGVYYIVKLVESPSSATDTGVVKVYRGKRNGD